MPTWFRTDALHGYAVRPPSSFSFRALLLRTSPRPAPLGAPAAAEPGRAIGVARFTSAIAARVQSATRVSPARTGVHRSSAFTAAHR